MHKIYNVLICTVPDEATAVKISRVLVTEKLAACCNIIPGLRSVLLVIKTRAEIYERLEKRIQELHPYEVPEILALTVNRGLSNYLKWVDENVE
jgi:periplasmic divalent cation tolerance protein